VSEDDPARSFLDETVPKHDEWEGREPEEGPARPRHVQHPAEPLAPLTAKERRANIIRGVGWTAASTGAFIAGAALSDDGDASLTRDEPVDPGYDAGADFGGDMSGM
jgi:hypothetical protein